MSGATDLKPIVGKTYCMPSQTILMVRKRPSVVGGGGFAVMTCSQQLAFTVDGCGILGTNRELILRDGDGAPVLFIRKKGGVVQALSFQNRWKGYLMDYEEPSKLIFSLSEAKPCILTKNTIRVSVKTEGYNKDWDFQVNGSFVEKACTINDRRGNIIAQVVVKEMMNAKDFYYVVVQPGYDQAFVVGVIAVLDNIHGESTRC